MEKNEGLQNQFRNYAEIARIKNLQTYKDLYGQDVFKSRNFLNIGAGNWRHPALKNVEYPTDWYRNDLIDQIDIEWDATSSNPIPCPDNSIELVYSSHTIEHLMPEHVRHLFFEAYRVLKPGGIIRITCPDFYEYWLAYGRKDQDFFAYPDLFSKYPFEQVFLYDLCGMLSECELDQPGIKLSTEYTAEVLRNKNMTVALDELCAHVDYERNRQKPNHVSWWTAEKVMHNLSVVGFSAYISGFGKSHAPVMRDTGYDDPLKSLTGYFDTTVPRLSLYVEAIK